MSQDANPFRSRLGLLVPINNLQPRQQEQLLAGSAILDVRRKEFVFRQGDRDGYAYYLLAGELEMIAGDQLIKKVIGGEAASFQPLAQLQPRQMSARAVTQVQVLRVERHLLDQLLSAAQGTAAEEPAIEVTELSADGSVDWLTALLQSELFSRIPTANAQRLLDTLESVQVEAGAVVIEQGSPGDYYYVVQEGRCEVCRATSRGREIRLAELGPGDTFGEEALVSNATRNATVRMLEAGTLGRLTKEQFIELIGTPVLHAVSLAEARALVAAGARWLDVRFPEECQANGLPGCLNLPLNLLRTRRDELDRSQHYVAYCDSGGRSSAAAFLLAQEGFEVCFVESGAIDELGLQSPSLAGVAPAIAPPSVADPAPAATPTAGEETDEVAAARRQIEEARRMLAAAEAARRDAERYVASKLADERARMQQDARTLKAHIAEATRIKDLLEARQREAAAAAAAERAALEQRVAAYRAATERTLREKEARIEQLYQAQAAQLEQLQIERAAAQQALDEARARVELESTQNRERLLAVQRLEAEIQRREQDADAALAAREETLRAALRAEMDAERQRLEREFARSAAEIAEARREQQAAEIERERAEQEAARIAEEFRERQREQVAQMQAALAAERTRLEASAHALEAALAEALTARAAAERARDEALAQLAALTARAASTPVAEEDDWRARIAAIEARATAAAQRLRAALDSESDALRARDDNAQRLDEARESQLTLVRQFGGAEVPAVD